MKNKKKIILGSIIGIFLGLIISTTYAIFSYSKTGDNNKLIAGDIYMHYNESNTLNFYNAIPQNTYTEGEYFEFTVEGKNTNKNKDIIYDIVLNYGDSPVDTTKTIRIKDELLRFRLVEVIDDTENEIFTNKSYVDLNGTRIHKTTIPAETNSKITHRYRVYAWISNTAIIGNTADADYTLDDWNKVYGSVKVSVTGDFADKKVLSSVYDIVKTGAQSDSNIHFYEVNGDSNGNGNFVRNTTINDQYPIYYFRGNVDNNNILFANKCWKIVRTTETGGTKLIYNGEQKKTYVSSLDQNNYTIVTNEGGWTFDSTDNSWNINITNDDGAEISFKMPSGTEYLFELSGTTGPSADGMYSFYKDGTRVKREFIGYGDDILYQNLTGTLTADNVLKILYSGSGSASDPVVMKIKMWNSTSEVASSNCDNSGALSMLPLPSPFNSNRNSLAYVGYNYGDVYTFASDAKSGTYGNSVSYSNGKYTLNDTVDAIDANHHYICDDENCSKVRYYHYESRYILLENGDTVETALKKMLSESNDTIKSPIQQTINTWYENNIKTNYGKYVEDTKWCNDRSIDSLGGWNPNGGKVSGNTEDYTIYFSAFRKYRYTTTSNGIKTTNTPVLTCPNENDVMYVGNGKIDNPIGLLTFDEAGLAGLTFTNSSSNKNYLLSNSQYWLLSPATINEIGNWAYMGAIYVYGLTVVELNNTSTGARPVISLKYGTVISDGDGSVDNPYVVKTTN